MPDALVLPNQLFQDHSWLGNPQETKVWLVEEPLFFGDEKYPILYHSKKLILHRASMKSYQDLLTAAGFEVEYIEHRIDLVEWLFSQLKGSIVVMDPVDFELERRIKSAAVANEVEIEWVESQLFINTNEVNDLYRKPKKRWFMADYYKHQRRTLDVMMDGDEPVGGKWSFDEDNRKKIPKKLIPEIPDLEMAEPDQSVVDAIDYVSKLDNSIGSPDDFGYPTTHEQAERWLEQFLAQRFDLFGPYEDALVPEQSWLYHSVLTPMLNIGLLTPQQIVDAALDYASQNEVRLNSLEGFVRQIIGWREFMRATYRDIGVEMRTSNHWEHNHAMPAGFYDASTGIEPIDDVIRRVLKHGYCHHIERLMVLGGFMFLCEIHPKQIYKWFMELFVDAYDWVMVPNVYGMSQNADGGLITTKPYFSGSAYLKKMGHSSGDWGETWDGLYWRWIHKNHDQLAKNHRWSMMCAQLRKMDEAKLETHLENAENYLRQLHAT